ncbi:MAG: hypothetical protein B6241_08470 [Spirochaetaceae bacterium 4572_59]|nr:MAG: hypothetical protein B6241_08470 [Spirochaetaceae bacterium 4572_59]
MLNLKFLIHILEPDFTKKILYLILILAMIPIMDCILFINFSYLMGEYLFLAILLLLSLSGFIFSRHLVRRTHIRLKTNLHDNIFLLKDYNSLPAALMVSFLLIMPGIISTIIALVFSIPCFRNNLGKRISLILKIDWKEIHEYLNIID